jgi:hypothetical protein
LLRTIALATLVAGTFDILSAFAWTALAGGNLAGVLPSVASGPFGDGMAKSSVAQPLGLLVHFAIMLAMAAVYVLAAERLPILKRQWFVSGLLYGLLLWLVMYGIVLQVRWDVAFPGNVPAVVRQLISHCLLVGVPIAWIAARRVPRPA